MVTDLISALDHYGLKTVKGKLVLPEWVRRIKIDVGLAFNAPNSEIWLQEMDDLIVFGFEPVEENFKKLFIDTPAEYFKIDPSRIGKTFFPLKFAIGGRSSSQEMYITSEDLGCSSMLRPKEMPVSRIEKVSVIRLDEFLELLPWERIPIVEHLKTDCQGMDIEVLKSANEYISKILVITLEPDDYSYENSSNSYLNLAKFLAKHHFVNYESPNVALSILSHKTARFRGATLIKKFLRKLLYKQVLQKKPLPGVHDPTFVNTKLSFEFSEALQHIKQRG